jgi:hypothetical protein
MAPEGGEVHETARTREKKNIKTNDCQEISNRSETVFKSKGSKWREETSNATQDIRECTKAE